MLHLTHGDENHLEGKVTIYSRLPTRKEFYAIVAGADPDYVCKKLGIPSEGVADLMSAAQNTVKKALHESGIPNPEKLKMDSLFGVEFWTADEHIIEPNLDDIIFAGNFAKDNICETAAKLARDLYIIRYMDQLISPGNPIQESKPEEPQKTYKDIEKESFMSYVSSHFIGPMLDAKKSGNSNELKSLKRKFTSFLVGAPFLLTGVELGEYIEGQHNVDVSRVESVVMLMDAIVREDYEKAQSIRSRLKT